jgi:carbamoyl-phosphate synthase large subunit
MALSGRLTGRTSTLLRAYRPSPIPSTRAFTARSAARFANGRAQQPIGQNAQKYVRLFSSSVLRFNATQAAPSAKAYLESGVIKRAANPVNVKKVLVIGSGGLSIGQAGEFDYSGECWE